MPFQIENFTEIKLVTQTEPVLDVILQIVGTIIGAFFGLLFALLLYRYKKINDMREQKKTMLNSLISELQELKKGFEKPHNIGGNIAWDNKKRQFTGKYGLASVPVIESVIQSGGFLFLSSILQTKLSELNDTVQHYNWFIKQILSFYQAGIFINNELAEKEANRLIKYQKEQFTKLEEKVNKTLPILQDELQSLLP